MNVESIVRIEMTMDEAHDLMVELNEWDLSDTPELGKLFDTISDKTGLDGTS
jgi:hypothetical protein